MGSHVKGSQNVQNRIKALKDKAIEIDGSHDITLNDLFTSEFIRSCSRFSSLEQFIHASGFSVESAEDLESIPDDQWDQFVSENTSYNNWQEMVEAAQALYMKQHFGL